MNKTLNNQTPSDKTKQPVRCPFCSRCLNIFYGFYLRFHPERAEIVKVQRYLCKALGCPVKTFSIPPFPLLRIVQNTFQKMKQAYTLWESGMNQASICRESGLTRGIIKRLSEFTRRFFPWLEHEQGIADWGPDFENDPYSVWPCFIRDFSHSFYPNRYGHLSPTQLIHFKYQPVMP